MIEEGRRPNPRTRGERNRRRMRFMFNTSKEPSVVASTGAVSPLSISPKSAMLLENHRNNNMRETPPSKAKKGEKSLKRFLTFRKKSKSSKSLEKPTSNETLYENVKDSSEHLTLSASKAPIASRETLTDEAAPVSLQTEVQVKYLKRETKVDSPKIVTKSAKIKKDKIKSTKKPGPIAKYRLLAETPEEKTQDVGKSQDSLQVIEVDENAPESVHKATFKLGSSRDFTSSCDTLVDIENIPSASRGGREVSELSARKTGSNETLEEIITVYPSIPSRTVSKKSGIEVISLGNPPDPTLSLLVNPVISGKIEDEPSTGQDGPQYSGKSKKSPDEYISIAFLNIRGSQEIVSEDLQSSAQLRNTLQAESTKKPVQCSDDEDSCDSFKSTVSPELRNTPERPAVDIARQGWSEAHVPSPRSPPRTSRTKTLWKRLFRINSGVSPSKSPELKVDGIMSQNPGPSKKERTRGRGSTERKAPVPSTSSTPAVQKPEEKVTTPPLLEAKESPTKKISGDDLRKQLSEGLKNGAGKAKNGDTTVDKPKSATQIPEKASEIKAELSKITDSAAAVSAVETQAFIQQEKKEKEEKKKQEASEGAQESSEDGATSTSGTDAASTALPPELNLPATDSKKEHLYKILVIGELGTGKTSIIKRYVHQFFSQHYRATIGVDFALKVINWDENSIIRLQLWDIAGQERFGNMTRVYYKEAVGAFIVFDVTRSATLDAVQKWKLDLDSKVQLSDGSPIPCVLLANKCDQPKEGLVNNKNKMDEYCRENGFSGWFETSAKDNINIEEAARSLVLNILNNDKLRQGDRAQDPDKIALGGTNSDSGGRSCNC